LLVRAIGSLLVTLALVVVTAWAATDAAARAGSARAGGDGLCELIDRVLPLDCGPSSPPPRPAPSRTESEAPSGPGQPPPTAQRVRAGELVRRSSGMPLYDPKRLAITFRAGVSRERIGTVLTRAGVTLEQAVPAIHAYMVGVEPSRRASVLALLRASDAVATADREGLVQALSADPNDADWDYQWGLRLAGFPAAWNQSRASSPVTIAVVDTGVDPAQPDLRGALLAGFDFVNQTGDAPDDEGHGTAVAGIIAARSNNREGIAGICPSCSIMPVKVLDKNGTGDDTVVAAGIVWAADHGAQVINLSLGGPGATPELGAALAYARGKGVIIVAAAGNDGVTTPFYPAADPNALSVAATDNRDHPYAWSNHGSWVDLTAPGCNPAPNLEGGYDNFCGTSSAAPVVVGLVGLALATSPTATRDEVAQALEHGAVPITGFVQYGRINAPTTLSFLGSPAAPAIPLPSTTSFRGTLGVRAQTRGYRLTVAAGQVTALLSFRGARTLSLTLSSDADPTQTARVTGTSPLQLSKTAPAGPIRLTVHGGKGRASFVLSVRGSPHG
jgi:subtilisin family serine protease